MQDYASMVYALALYLSLSAVTNRVRPKWLSLSSHKQCHTSDSQGTLVFWCKRSSWNFNEVTPQGCQIRGVWKICDSTNNLSLYLGSGKGSL